MKFRGNGKLNADYLGKINYKINQIQLYISNKWYEYNNQTAQFFTGYGLNVTYGKGKRKINIPARVGIYSNWQESTEKIISKILGLPLLNKSLNKDNINGIQTIEFLTSHFEHVVVKYTDSNKVTIEVNNKIKYSGSSFHNVSFEADGISYGLKYEYTSSSYEHYSMHIKKMSLENYDREEKIKASTYLRNRRVVSKQNIIKIPKFDPEILINKYNSSIKKDIFRYEEISSELLNHNKGKVISLGKVFFYQLNTEILKQNSSINPKIYLGNNYKLEAQSSTTYKTIDVELSFDKNGKKEKLPVIVMGDFNANPNSKVIKKFAAGEYNTDRFVAVQEVKKELYKKSTMSGFKGIEKGLHIDYIFVSEDLEIVDVDIIKDNENGKYPSDHYPLIADIILKK